MDADHYSDFRHEAVHELMRLNENCEREFRVSSWDRWDYDLERGTLTFSQEGVPKVVASIQVVGTTSTDSGTWLWGWANENLPRQVSNAIVRVRTFGQIENLPALSEPSAPNDEHYGWAMTAIAAKVLGAKGGYRCPWSGGFIYLVYTDLSFASDKPPAEADRKQIECGAHGEGFASYVCEHLVSNPAQEWFSEAPTQIKPWPDAWCATCDAFFREQGQWNEKNESKIKIKLLCHRCYERFRSEEPVLEGKGNGST